MNGPLKELSVMFQACENIGKKLGTICSIIFLSYALNTVKNPCNISRHQPN
jgi:hypothetical protein